VSIFVDDSEDGRAAHDAHISESRYGAPGRIVDTYANVMVLEWPGIGSEGDG
jgi:hypothetical protein